MPLKIGIILQCRINSERLPGKTLMNFGRKSLIEHTFYNATKSKLANECIVAIPNTPENKILAEYLEDKSIPYFKGSEENLVSRHLSVAETKAFDVIVRIPADNPLPHQSEVDRIITHHISNNIEGFSSNLSEVFDSGYPDGIGAEVFSTNLLRKIDQSRATAQELEHVHLNFFDYTSQKPKSSDVKVSTVTCPPSFARPDIRLDINTNQDLQYFKDMFSFFEGSNFDITDIIKWHDSIDLSKYQNGIGQ